MKRIREKERLNRDSTSNELIDKNIYPFIECIQYLFITSGKRVMLLGEVSKTSGYDIYNRNMIPMMRYDIYISDYRSLLH